MCLTHLHFDHCGGSIGKGDRWCPAFKNASFWTNKTHWQWATREPNAREKASFLKENILPMQESSRRSLLKWPITVDKTMPTPWVIIFFKSSLRAYRRHDDACYKIQDKTLVYMADLLPSWRIFRCPMWWVMTCFRQHWMKKSIFDEAVPNDYVLFLNTTPWMNAALCNKRKKG